MKALVQRVSEASVTVGGDTVGAIGPGLLVLAGFGSEDDEAQLRWMAGKVAGLRIFPDRRGDMNRSLLDVGGGILVVSQFTLHASCRKGRRPSFTDAAPPERAEVLYDLFVEMLRGCGAPVESGRFGAMMQVSLVNDGPVTIMIDSPGERG